MLAVQLEDQGGRTSSFQIPCRFAGCDPGRELAISRYRPYWKYNATRSGSGLRGESGQPLARIQIDWSRFSAVPAPRDGTAFDGRRCARCAGPHNSFAPPQAICDRQASAMLRCTARGGAVVAEESGLCGDQECDGFGSLDAQPVAVRATAPPSVVAWMRASKRMPLPSAGS